MIDSAIERYVYYKRQRLSNTEAALKAGLAANPSGRAIRMAQLAERMSTKDAKMLLEDIDERIEEHRAEVRELILLRDAARCVVAFDDVKRGSVQSTSNPDKNTTTTLPTASI